MTGRSGHKIRRRVGYVPQLDSIDARMPMTVHDVVALGRYGRLGWFRRPGKRDKQVVNETLAMVGMTLLADRPVGQLSGGEQERAAIARCLTQEPELFLLDEPTAALDFRAKIDILELVKRIRSERDLTTVFVTHDLGFLPQTCDRVVLMKSGLICGDGLPEDVLTDDNLASLYDLPLQAVKRRREIGVCA
jgi:ABC-type Mn2+/Zn2+ transport system ATPase subunit